MTLVALLALCAFLCAVASAAGKAPIWVAVVLLCVLELLRVWG